MANRALCVGADAILMWFKENAETPFYSVWKGTDLLYQNNTNDMEIAAEKLYNNTIAAEQNGFNDVLMLKLHPIIEKNGYVTKKTDVIGSCTFRPAELVPYQPLQLYNQQAANSNDLILQKLNGIESRLNNLEEEEIEEEEPQKKGLGAIFENLLQNEQVQAAILGIAGNFINKIMPQNNDKTLALGAITDEQQHKIDTAINILKQHDECLGDDLMRLADMAINNNGQFKFLLSMLRK